MGYQEDRRSSPWAAGVLSELRSRLRALDPPLVGLLAFLTLYNNIVNLLPRDLHDRIYVPLNLLALSLVLLSPLRSGALSWTDMGLHRHRLGRSLAWGLLAGAVVPSVLFLLIPLSGLGFVQLINPAGYLPWRELAFRTLVRIPLGTALFEEVLFRGAAYGMALHSMSRRAAAYLSAAAFALWHVTVSLITLRNTVIADSPLAMVPAMAGALLATFGGGLLFVWLRERTNNLAGCILTHWLINSLASVAASLATL